MTTLAEMTCKFSECGEPIWQRKPASVCAYPNASRRLMQCDAQFSRLFEKECVEVLSRKGSSP